MNSDKNILFAFLLNISFSIIELFGGIFTNSIAIISDSIHDFSDSISIGISYLLEKISKKQPDDKYTYGYSRYSLLGAILTNSILITGSILIIVTGVERIIKPVSINYDGMIIFAIIGVTINFLATCFTKNGESLNQKAVNLHMLEDVLGWLIVLLGSIILKITKIDIIDSILSILVAIFILINAVKSLKQIVDIFLEKIPNKIKIEEIVSDLKKIKGVNDVHHIHIWSMDGINNYATMHVVANLNNFKDLKIDIKENLKKYGIKHTTIEMEEDDECKNIKCEISDNVSKHHQH